MKNIAYAILAVLPVVLTIGQASSCTGGTCYDYKLHVCPGGYKRFLCRGLSNIRCCMKCDSDCDSKERYYRSNSDGRCTSAGGKCMVDSNYCPSNDWRSGMCGGPSARRCCVASGSVSSSGTCTLKTYTGSNVRDYKGRAVRVDSGFVDAMDRINRYAEECKVVVMVTSSFRKENVPVSGAIVPPASKSNHKVGHAIDMNLDTGGGWCDGACLAGQKNHEAKCFTNKIQSDNNLRWGQDFSKRDPVHIDDGLNIRNPSSWNELFAKLQRNC